MDVDPNMLATEKKEPEVSNSKLTESIPLQIRNLLVSGVTDIQKISNAIHERKVQQLENKLFPYDRFTKYGSNSQAPLLNKIGEEPKNCILWCINHYLGLNRNEEVIDRARETLKDYGTGCGTSAMSGGMSALHKKVESAIAERVGKEAAMLFPTGYTANLGALSALPGTNDLLLFDKESHASIIDGVKLSGKKWMPFAHNNMRDLERKILRNKDKFENIIVIVESAYSMSGDICPLKEVVEIKKRHGVYLYVDEAHSFGFYGKDGAGLCNEMNVTDDVDFIMSTLSKSTASIGGFVACSAEFATLFQFSANAYIFQACITPVDAATVLAALDVIKNKPEIIESLHEKNQFMRDELTRHGYDLKESASPIIPIYINDPDKLHRVSKSLYEKGVYTVAVLYPAVRKNEGRLRFIVNESHSKKQILETVELLNLACKEEGVEI